MSYRVENRYQDGGWEVVQSGLCERAAYKLANHGATNSIAYGMLRVVDERSNKVIEQWSAGENQREVEHE